MRALTLFVVATGCLEAPPPPGQRDGGGTPDAGAADAGPFTCPEDGGAPRAWPPAGTIALRDPIAVDLDRDGFDDLVVASQASGEEGIYILRGRSTGFGAVYDGWVDTAGFKPYRVAAADVGGSEHPDLLAVGVVGGAQEYLRVYEGSCATIYDPEPRYREIQASTPAVESNPFLVAVGRFDDDASPDVLVGDIYHLVTLEISTWDRTMFQSLELYGVPGPGGGPWLDAITPRLVPNQTTPSLHDIVIARDHGAAWLPNEGSILFQNPPLVIEESPTRFGTFWDFDGDGADDVVAAGGPQAFLLLPRVQTSLALAGSAAQLDLLDAELDGLALHDFDGDGAPELIYLDHVDAGVSGVGMLPDVIYDGAFRADVSGNRVGFVDLDPRLIVVGDFVGDDAAEILAIEPDTGRLTCVRYLAGSPPRLMEGCE